MKFKKMRVRKRSEIGGKFEFVITFQHHNKQLSSTHTPWLTRVLQDVLALALGLSPLTNI